MKKNGIILLPFLRLTKINSKAAYKGGAIPLHDKIDDG